MQVDKVRKVVHLHLSFGKVGRYFVFAGGDSVFGHEDPKLVRFSGAVEFIILDDVRDLRVSSLREGIL